MDEKPNPRGHMFLDERVCTVCGLPYGVWLHNGRPACRTRESADLLDKFRRAVAAVKSGVAR